MPRPAAAKIRERQLNIALYPEEYAALQKRADACGLPLVEFARTTLLAMRAASVQVVLPSRLERLNLEQLKRVGNNLNQIARQLHALGTVVPEELGINLAAVRDLIAQMDRDDR